jgi:hypothetical protein
MLMRCFITPCGLTEHNDKKIDSQLLHLPQVFANHLFVPHRVAWLLKTFMKTDFTSVNDFCANRLTSVREIECI